MITVEWDDFNAPRGPDHSVKRRTGKLLQIGMARLKGERDSRNVAFVITTHIDTDPGSPKGDKVILAVELTRIEVKGVEVPLFGD